MNSTISIRPIIAAPAARPQDLSDRLRGLVALTALWAARRRQRRELRELDDRLLRDIGLTREQVLREAAKPFWRA